MNHQTKRVLGVLAALLVGLGVGWQWGASGRSDVERALQTADLRNNLCEAQGAVLAARVDLYDADLGAARRHLESAKEFLRHATGESRNGGQAREVNRLNSLFAWTAEAQQLAGRVDRSATSRVAGAARAIDDAPGTGPKQ